MSAIKIINLDELIKATSTKQLKEKDVQIAVMNAQIAEDVPLSETHLPINFAVKASSTFQILSIKAADVTDNVVGKDGLVAPIPAKVWLKYTLNAAAEAKGGGTLHDIGLNLQANQTIRTSVYCLHNEEDTVMKAIGNDLADLLSIFNKNALLKKMQVGEAVSLQISGGLQAAVTAKWADVFSQSLSGLTSLVNTKKTLAIKVNSGLQAAFKVKLTDDFVLKIAKTGEDEFKIVLKKDLSKTVGLQAFAGVEVALDKPENVDKIFTEVLEGLLGTAEKKLDEIIRKIKNDLKLDASDELLLKAVLARLGEEVNVDINSIPNKIAAYKLKVRTKITELANSAIKVGFTLEYQRSSATSELLVAKLNSKSLDLLHWDLLKFNLLPFHQALAEAAKNGVQHPDIKVESYLNRKTTNTEYSWGFSIGIGKFVNLSSIDKTKIEVTETKNEQGQRQIACLGEQFYTSNWNGMKQFWGSVFTAQLPNFSQKPTFDAFNYGFSLAWKPENKKATDNELAKIVDIAALWKCLDDSSETTFPLSQQLVQDLAKAANLRYIVSLKMGNTIFLNFLKIIALQSKDDRLKGITKAFAMCTPYNETVPIRQNIRARTRAYLPLWKAYTEQNLGDVAQTAASVFQADRSLSDYEKNKGSVGNFASLADDDGRLLRTIQLSLDIFVKLQQNISSKKEFTEKEFRHIFENANALWEDSFGTQVFGAYLMDLAESQGLLTEIERIFTIQYKDGNEDKTLNLTQGLGGKVI
jgi:hypothetical protein